MSVNFPPAISLPTDDGYDILARWLAAAYEQSRHGKGVQRHGSGKPFDQQQIIRNGRDTGGIGAMTQAHKKIEEALGMLARGEKDRALTELKGAMVYLCASCDGITNGRSWVVQEDAAPQMPTIAKMAGPAPQQDFAARAQMVDEALALGKARSFAGVDID